MKIQTKILISLVSIFCFFNDQLAADEIKNKDATAAKPTLGVIVPLSGPLAFFGNDYKRTYDLALEARPELKDRFEIKWEDSAYDSKQAVSAFNKLVTIDTLM